ncbi:MAG: ATP-binding protein [Candidatus Microgenomates bacterium]
MYFRHIDSLIKNHFKKRNEVLIVLGARQVGKTTLLKKIFPEALYLSVDNETIRQNLERYDSSFYKTMIPKDKNLIVIDEIHLLKNPGRCAKIFYDNFPKIKLIITGSSSFHIKNKTSESLAGRKVDYHLFPLTFTEYLNQKSITKNIRLPILEQLEKGEKLIDEKAYLFDIEGILQEILIFGSYPHLINHPKDNVYLKNLIDSVIFKDLLDLSLIENRQAAKNLLILLAYQIGSLINYSELSLKLGIEVKTVKRYLSLFEQSFIIYTLPPFLSNKRDEITKMKKVYFYDLGLRNALINNFQPLNIRTDFGALFENFIVSEIIKANFYGDFGYNLYFWRTKKGTEIDLILEKEDKITAIEIKTKKSKSKAAFAFKNRFPKAKILTINKANFY